MAEQTFAYLTPRGAQLPEGENDRLVYFEDSQRWAIKFDGTTPQSCIFTIPNFPATPESASIKIQFATEETTAYLLWSSEVELLNDAGSQNLFEDVEFGIGNTYSGTIGSPTDGELMTYENGFFYGVPTAGDSVRIRLTRLADNFQDDFDGDAFVFGCSVVGVVDEFEPPETSVGQILVGGEDDSIVGSQYTSEGGNHIYHRFEDEATFDLTGDDARCTINVWNSDTHDVHTNLKIAANDINLECNDLLLGNNVSIDSEALAPVLTIESPFPDTNYYLNTLNMQRGSIVSGYQTEWAGIKMQSNTATVHCVEDGSVKINDEYTLPAADGSDGNGLVTNGAGVVSWQPVLVNPLTNAGQIIVGGEDGVPGVATGISLNNNASDNAFTISGTTSGWVTVEGDTVQGTLQAAGASSRVDLVATHDIHIRPATDSGTCVITGNLRVSDAYTMPNNDGSAGQGLTTDGSGGVGWTDVITSPYTGTIATDTTTGLKLGNGSSEKLGFFGATPVAQPASADQAAVTLNNADGDFGSLAFSASYSDIEVTALRDNCEELADDVRADHVLLHEIRNVLITLGLMKGSA